jgi:hypothetical protein
MRSLLWTSIFYLLMAALGLTLILVVPVPRKFRSRIVLSVSKLGLKEKLKMPLVFLCFALVLALADTAKYLHGLHDKHEEAKLAVSEGMPPRNSIDRLLTKEKKYKAERNIYLVGFALTLIFVIGRITELMQEHAELEGKIENLKLAASMMEKHSKEESPSDGDGDVDAPIDGIEMKSMGSKKKD